MHLITRRGILSGSLGAGLGVAALIGVQGLVGPVLAQTNLGSAAPGFALTDSNGRARTLNEFKGKTVVLEWTNHQCPYVGKHYRSNNMQALQKKWTGQGVVWLSVISSAPGEEGHVTPQQANQLTSERNAAPSAVLFDPKGTAGRAYGARTTPHMYIINGDGVLVYMGGIDDQPTARLEDVKIAKNYVDQALSEIAQGKPVSANRSRAYGCSVKYAS